MKVASIQLEMKDRSVVQNVDHALDLTARAPRSDLILLPEIWPCGYFSFHRYKTESETLEGPLVNAFGQLARDRRCHILMGSIVEKRQGHLHNTSILLNPVGQIQAIYRKIHLFGYQSEERRLLTPGKSITVADTPWGASGLSTCYDLRFPELYRQMLVKGARFFLVASAWPAVRRSAWRLFNQTRALENLAFLISCNCAGANTGVEYGGHSMIVDPSGQILAEGGSREEVITAEIDPTEVDRAREEYSFLNDRIL